MPKTHLISIILISSLLGACGFHVPKDRAPINASITGATDSTFVSELKKHLDVNIAPSFRIEVGEDVQRSQTTAYKSSGNASSYTLTLSVPIRVWRAQKLLLSKNLIATTTLKETELSQANTLQTEHGFVQLRKIVVARMLRILTQLNAN